ncbi:cytochrome c [Oryzomonas japonica]|uniref:Cytochrome c n=1 Tax=Oryzomonas japonica TaxID=2603858 RepID=A0A7J4ZNM0_9BACT|nr:cytochrome c [Oryzomonas japonica]KAB0664432.1 cytochrome c [Oryzomonas japonica]
MRIRLLFILMTICAGGAAGAADLHRITLPPPTVSLKEGAGVYVVRRYCSICHSLDYITTQPKFPKAKWQAEVAKMIKVYGAPIPEESVKVISDYIAAYYGTGS